MAEIFPSLMKTTNLQIQEVQQTPSRINTKHTKAHHNQILKIHEKGKIQAARKKEKHYLQLLVKIKNGFRCLIRNCTSQKNTMEQYL